MRRSTIDFDVELSRGLASYNDTLAEWWLSRSRDGAHRRAYRNIAAYVRDSVGRDPGVIVDYACGAGDLIFRLAMLFPKSVLIGMDGSRILLERARRRLRRVPRALGDRITLIECSLPCHDLPRTAADLAIFAFPNLVWSGGTEICRPLRSSEIAAARLLSRGWDDDAPESREDRETTRASLLLGRRTSRDLRELLKHGGLCFRVEYARAKRHELSELDTLRISFEEGTLDRRVGRHIMPQWFRVAASAYFRSRAIEDVDQQVGKPGAGAGGYVITVLRAI